VFCLGGSTVRGRPYTNDTAFPDWLQIELSERDPQHNYEVVNCGGLSYASYRLVHILDEVLQYSPDLIVLATGHNEFLEDRTYQSVKTRSPARAWVENRLYSLRTVQEASRLWHDTNDSSGEGDDSDRSILPDKVSPRLDDASGYASYHRDDVWREGVIRHYEQSVREMIAKCRQAKIPVVLVSLGSNLRDCPPFKSEHKPELSLEQERDWQAEFDRATAAAKDPGTALMHYYNAEAIDAKHALLLYRIARTLDRLGKLQEAKEYYIRAKDNDICPLRMLEEMYDVLHAIATETDTPILNAGQLFEQQSSAGIPGYRWYMDHVHPTIGAHQQIARETVNVLQDMKLLTGLSDLKESERRAAYRRQLDELGPVYLDLARERLNWLEDWAQRQRLHEETIPDGRSAHLRHGFRRLELGDSEQAWSHFSAALSADQSLTERDVAASRSQTLQVLLDYALQLFQQGQSRLATRLLEQLRKETTESDQRARIDLGLIVLALELDETAVALSIYERIGAAADHFTTENNRWLAAMPDALDRCQTAGKASTP
jgi:tetratricopeptide (TPR) repeat protein